ncbi:MULTISPECIES: ABC transporter permease [Halorubrum]|jgi:putative ABC transport system permease protein|uniref:ABC transporter substrate-binding protein n=1 Tax=Halorubrum tropicale TaxID=1765655 RepID=A0A0M9AV24_9EURY|nr:MULTISPECIES: ABC transporter permease [Halorubrum]KOX98101.1 ABC transporter substrate-binding protein [Halorubrum tropicale]RLM50636.1 ABC transporter permease [Halorubrum sp. Atlit-28R]TKX42282.1 ABC transporter permease [Halorubrum sp. ARQ200]TKX49439.1 ABC transporter permease [Halorubrum sp. ASP121]TKX57759.1 ABC transporter permease [Halorubrum sp. ASP1]
MSDGDRTGAGSAGWLRGWRPAVSMASRNLRRNRVRTVLAVLGVCIGVLAVAALGIFGNVLALGADDAIGDIGTQVVVSPNADAGVESLSDADVASIRRAVGEPAVVPLYSDSATVARQGDQTFATVYGIEEPALAYEAAEGRLPERHRQGAILGAGIAADLDAGAGDTVEIAGSQVRVIAVLVESQTFSPVAPDDAVFLPESAFSADGYAQALVISDTGAEARAAANAIREEVNAREERVDLFELAALVDEINEFFDLLSTFLLGLGAISLVVAGVSILNVMLMSTVERRQEIGVMRAVGVARRDVLRVLLAEAGLIGAAGAAAGTLLTVLLVAGLVLATPAVDAALVIDPTNGYYLLLALVFGVGVGLVSGAYPAWKAANQRPVEALRN